MDIIIHPEFDWAFELVKNQHDIVPGHTLVAAFEAKVNFSLGLKQVEGYHFSSHSLIFGCSRLLAPFKMDAHRGLDYAYGIRALHLYGVYTTFKHERVQNNRLQFKALEILYSEGDEFRLRIGNHAWDRIMIYLQNFGSVPATIKHYHDYYPPAFDHKNYIYQGRGTPGERVKYHCILLLGYNSQCRYFSYLNSWGSDFGNNGRAYVDFKNVVRAYAPLFEEDQQYFEDSQMIMGRDPLPAPA
ncbi:hypothetical protein PIB30_020851 [Stylosanthes scabra]|uniref:Peptidase C1A papain C-terminal domain-containing protein n=1 Tax=Stylosanthes scabra TaxID=79078 RepID=A0ABU6V9G3_9FABA|nr:hypothetical protein [Stylosanthes scabra]